MPVRFRDAYFAALFGGLAILLTFFVWHWFNIAKVWVVLAEGIVGVALASAGIAWAWVLSRRAGWFAPPWGGLRFGAVFAAGILMGELIGLARGPQPDPTGVLDALPEVAFVSIPVAVVALVGWRAARWKGVAAYGLAGLVLLLYLGGSVMHRGGVGLGLGLFAILFPGYLLSGAAIGWLEPRLARRG